MNETFLSGNASEEVGELLHDVFFEVLRLFDLMCAEEILVVFVILLELAGDELLYDLEVDIFVLRGGTLLKELKNQVALDGVYISALLLGREGGEKLIEGAD